MNSVDFLFPKCKLRCTRNLKISRYIENLIINVEIKNKRQCNDFLRDEANKTEPFWTHYRCLGLELTEWSQRLF